MTCQARFKVRVCKHFSSCGEVTDVVVFSLAVVLKLVLKEKDVDKAVELSGRQVGEMNLVVELPPSMEEDPESPKNGKRKKMTYRLPCGYTPLESKLEFANKKKKEKKKLKKEKENENEKSQSQVA